MFSRTAQVKIPPIDFHAQPIHARAREYLPQNLPDLSPSQCRVRYTISQIRAGFPEDTYWLKVDEEKRFPSEFFSAITRDSWLGICMPREYGGRELGLQEAVTMMSTIAESGAGGTGASSIHMNIFGLAPVVKGKRERVLSSQSRIQVQSRAVRDGDTYVLSGSKIWTSTAQVAEKILILVRTTPVDQARKPTHGLSLFYTDLDRAQAQVMEIPKMDRAAVDSNSLFFEDWRVSTTDLIGSEGDGFKQILYGMNAERILIAGEAVGLGFAALRRTANYAAESKHDIGRNKGISTR
ncbi:hypothetical protein VTN00DRAFT_9366 [Thermoascus crustaceus]|uniref:uncharacterized protein n=1 Tax=Thermoascus crustaceus TaxID=5088 RepID=UPI0037432518